MTQTPVPTRAEYAVLADNVMTLLKDGFSWDSPEFKANNAAMDAIRKAWEARRFARITSGEYVDLGVKMGHPSGYIVVTKAAWKQLKGAQAGFTDRYVAKQVQMAFNRSAKPTHAPDEPLGVRTFLVEELEGEGVTLHSNNDLCYRLPDGGGVGFIFGLPNEKLEQEAERLDEVIA